MDPKAWPTSGQNVCRCCLAEGCYKDISTEYFWMGKREVYSDMLNETFDVNISFSKSGSTNSRLICEPCISRLRDASEFKKQVVDCERMFMNHLSEPGSSTMAEPLSTLTPDDVKVIKVEAVKQEKDSDGDEDFADTTDFLDDDDDDEDDLDNQPLTKFATKVPKKEAVDIMDLLDNTELTIKRKAPTKTKAVPAKKAKTTTKVTAKATVSKAKTAARPKTAAATKAVVEKKKKDAKTINTARWNGEIIVKFTTAYPFRVPGDYMLCVYCNQRYDDSASLRSHIEESHKTFIRRHVFAHVSAENYLKLDCTDLSCRLCKEKFIKLDDAAAHLRNEHRAKLHLEKPLELLPYIINKDGVQCGICLAIQPGLRYLGRHLTSHFQNFTCESCGKSFINTGTLKTHTQTCNKDIVEFKCYKCRKSFPTTAERREHVMSNKLCWRYCCETCGERFMTWSLRESHRTAVHNTPARNYKCTGCTEVFDCPRMYRKHYMLTHNGDALMCQYCGKNWDSKKHLNEHLVTHTKEKPYECTVCAKAFGTKKNLVQHSWIHNEYKRFECRLCDKKFNQRVSWKTHMKGHHPELVDF